MTSRRPSVRDLAKTLSGSSEIRNQGIGVARNLRFFQNSAALIHHANSRRFQRNVDADKVFHVVVLLYKSQGHAIQQGPVSQYVTRATTPNFTVGDRFAHYGISMKVELATPTASHNMSSSPVSQ